MMIKYSSRTVCGWQKLANVLLQLQVGRLPAHILKVCLGIKSQAPDGFHKARHLQPVRAVQQHTEVLRGLASVCCSIRGMLAA